MKLAVNYSPENGRGQDGMPMGAEDWALAEWAFGRIGTGAWGAALGCGA